MITYNFAYLSSLSVISTATEPAVIKQFKETMSTNIQERFELRTT